MGSPYAFAYPDSREQTYTAAPDTQDRFIPLMPLEVNIVPLLSAVSPDRT